MLTPNEMREKVKDYCKANPVEFYGDRNDELSPELIETLLTDPDKFGEVSSECEFSLQDYWYSECYFEYVNTFMKEIDLDPEETPDNIKDGIRELIQDYVEFDYSDYWRVCCHNSNPHIVLEPINPDTGEGFYPPMYSLDFKENMDRARALMKHFGIRNYRRIENMYEHETLKVCGTVDLYEIFKTGETPKQWVIYSTDNLIFHTSWNGSGCLGNIKMRKDKSSAITCNVSFDNNKKYGVDAVYGFTGQWWRNELTPVSDLELNPATMEG